MTVNDSGFSIEKLTLPHEDPAKGRQIGDEWTTAYPCTNPIERGFVRQAIVAQMEKRRMERIRATVRAERVRTAVLYFDRQQEDDVFRCLWMFDGNCEDGLRHLTHSAAGCRWAIAQWQQLEKLLAEDGTWYGVHRITAIQLQGVSACLDQLFLSEPAFTTWLDCLAAQPNPKQKDIDKILDPMCVPKALQDRDVKLWPGNPAASRARLQALVDRELPRLRALEETLRVQYEEPARAAAQDLALATITKEEESLLRAERMHEQSYAQAVSALRKVPKQTAASRAPAAKREMHERAWGVRRGGWRVGRKQDTPAVSLTSSAPRPPP
jgi:hypothetical protein